MTTALLALCATLIVFSASGANAQSTFKCADTGNSAAQCAVLADFYYSTTGHTSWGATTTGWSAAASGVKTSYCTFTGVTCVSGDITRMCVVRICCAAGVQMRACTFRLPPHATLFLCRGALADA
jgi:hypothetical protein